jgi:peptide/nickel transport system substrate-binding protein
MLGWTPGTLDALNMLSNLAATRSEDFHNGLYNIGGYSNSSFDELIEKIQVAPDSEKRKELISKALSIVKDDFVYIPLHQQIVVWAGRTMSIWRNGATTTSSCAT